MCTVNILGRYTLLFEATNSYVGILYLQLAYTIISEVTINLPLHGIHWLIDLDKAEYKRFSITAMF